MKAGNDSNPPANRRIGVLLCDDSALTRITLKKIIESTADLYVAGMARNGEEALIKARNLRPGVIVLDVEMPVMDGLTALKTISAEALAPVLMFSNLTVAGAHTTLEALEAGAYDFIAKPGGSVNLARFAEEIVRKIRSAALSNPQVCREVPVSEDGIKAERPRTDPPPTVVRPAIRASGLAFKTIVIGVSTGGPRTIFEVLPLLPADLKAAVILVQHMPPTFTSAFAQRLNNRTAMPCVEAEAGMLLEKGKIFVARGGFHLKLTKKTNREILLRTPSEPRHLFMPSVDITMESVAEHFKGDSIAVLMTGMGWDGASGMFKINEQGGVTIVESRETAVVFGMPQEALKRGCVQVVAPCWAIAKELLKAVEDDY